MLGRDLKPHRVPFHAVQFALKSIMQAPENTSKQVERDSHGRFVKGQTGNAGGRPAVVREVRSLARQYTQAAVLTLVSIAADRKAPAAARVSACTELLNRGHGRPEQSISLASGEERDIPGDFVPTSNAEVTSLYEQVMAGLVPIESASAAMGRARIAPAQASPPPSGDPIPTPTVAASEDDIGACTTSVGQGRATDKAIASLHRADLTETPTSEPTDVAITPPADPAEGTPPSSRARHSTGVAAPAAHPPEVQAALLSVHLRGQLEADQRGRERAAVQRRQENEARVEEQNARDRAAALERARRLHAEEGGEW